MTTPTARGTVRERPILFSAPMVLALLAGTKTQTRRAFNARTIKLMDAAAGIGEISDFIGNGCLHPNDSSYVVDFCPYGKVGDKLWCRETWCHAETPEGSPTFAFRADNWTESPSADGKWKPSIFMPRKASRITLEITEVRVQKLRDISGEDALAEGCDEFFSGGYEHDYSCDLPEIANYRRLWESINGAGSWALNPFVWCIGFKLLSK